MVLPPLDPVPVVGLNLSLSRSRQKKHQRRAALIVGIICGSATLFSLPFVITGSNKGDKNEGRNSPAQTVPQKTAQEFQPTTILPATTNYSLPKRLHIPKIKIEAAISYTGLTNNGDMEAPTSIMSAGWYKYSALPGNHGSAVISGHLDGPKGQPGVFANLDELRQGDTFSIVDDRNQATHFIVRAIQIYKQDAQPSEVFRSDDGSHVNLVTCIGSWDRSQQRYMERLVVFADKSL